MASVPVGRLATKELKLLDREFRFLEMDAIVNPGNSGGPVLSLEDGSVVGMTSWLKRGYEGRSFAYPVEFTKDAIEEYRQTQGAPE